MLVDIFLIFVMPILILIGILVFVILCIMLANIGAGNVPWDEKYKSDNVEDVRRT